jgi:hypothetical protein
MIILILRNVLFFGHDNLLGMLEYWRNLLSFLPSDWVCNRNLPKLFYGWSPFWPHHKILKRNPGPDSLSIGAHGVSAKKIEVWLSQASGILQVGFRRLSLPYLHYYCTPNACFSDFSFSHCRTNVTQSSQSTAEILKIEMCKYLGSNFLGAIPPFTNERIRIMEQHCHSSTFCLTLKAKYRYLAIFTFFFPLLRAIENFQIHYIFKFSVFEFPFLAEFPRKRKDVGRRSSFVAEGRRG